MSFFAGRSEVSGAAFGNIARKEIRKFGMWQEPGIRRKPKPQTRQAIEEALRNGKVLSARQIAKEARVQWRICCAALNHLVIEREVEVESGRYKLVSQSYGNNE